MHKAMGLPRKCFNLIFHFAVFFQLLGQQRDLIDTGFHDSMILSLVITSIPQILPDCSEKKLNISAFSSVAIMNFLLLYLTWSL